MTALAKKLLTVDDVAGVLSLGKTKVRELIKDGRLSSVRVGRSLRIRNEDVEAFISRLSQPGGGI